MPSPQRLLWATCRRIVGPLSGVSERVPVCRAYELNPNSLCSSRVLAEENRYPLWEAWFIRCIVPSRIIDSSPSLSRLCQTCCPDKESCRWKLYHRFPLSREPKAASAAFCVFERKAALHFSLWRQCFYPRRGISPRGRAKGLASKTWSRSSPFPCVRGRWFAQVR